MPMPLTEPMAFVERIHSVMSEIATEDNMPLIANACVAYAAMVITADSGLGKDQATAESIGEAGLVAMLNRVEEVLRQRN